MAFAARGERKRADNSELCNRARAALLHARASLRASEKHHRCAGASVTLLAWRFCLCFCNALLPPPSAFRQHASAYAIARIRSLSVWATYFACLSTKKRLVRSVCRWDAPAVAARAGAQREPSPHCRVRGVTIARTGTWHGGAGLIHIRKGDVNEKIPFGGRIFAARHRVAATAAAARTPCAHHALHA